MNRNKIIKSEFQFYAQEFDIMRKLYRNYKDYDVHKIINERLNETYPELSKNSIIGFSNLIDQNIKVFPKIQRGIVFDVTDILNHTLKTAKILKFDKRFNLSEILIIRISISMNNYEVLKEIAEIISLNFNLITLAITIVIDKSTKSDDPNFVNFFEFINIILCKIKSHKFIKIFILIFDLPEENKLTFPLKFYDSLYSLINFKFLLGLILISIPQTDELGKKLCSAIINNHTLKVLLLEFSDPIMNYLDDLSNAIIKMKGLYSFSLIGGGIDDAKVKDFSAKVSNLKIFNYKKQF